VSHITGTIQVLATPMVIGPGTTAFNPPPSPAPGGTKLLVLHFQNLALQPSDEIRIELGYDVDRYTAADAPEFWTRPINVYAFPSGVQITYVSGGGPAGSVQLDRYGRGEEHQGESGHPSFSNCDPFYQGNYQEPSAYDPFWFCTFPPNWENAAFAPAPVDMRASVARSVGMIVSVEASTFTGLEQLSTCSVTLVDSDKVITAGHCHKPAEALNSSVTFDYQTLADGSRPPGYSPRFYKVTRVLAHHYDNVGDFSLLQLAEAPPGVPVIQMRPDVPGVGEQVFGVHHPNGAVKKLSIPHAEGSGTVFASSASAINVSTNFSVSGGSSGSGLFDLAGRLTGVLSNGDPCHGSQLNYFPSAGILQAIAPAPPMPATRDVMVVFDRSGSMTLDDGAGRMRIETARDALSLFVQLVRAGVGNRLGLVSFSTSASSPVDFAVSDLTAAAKDTLIGPAPYTTGKLLGLNPGGSTTIGGGLVAAQAQIASAGGPNPKAILLMTDGLENTPPMVADVEASLAATTIHAIGFGAESSLNGPLLSALAASHGGLYTRAGNGLALEKFFSNAFGNIFEYGLLVDPEFDLPADQQSGTPVAFSVCSEDAITAVVGWDNLEASLYIVLTTPGGATIFASTAGVESASGRNWTFLRLPLPIGGERDGGWQVNVVRPGGGEVPPPSPALRYFVNVIPTGGPRMSRFPDRTERYYTGDRINPMVMVREADGGWPDGMSVSMTVTRPDTSVGNVLAKAGLGAPGSIDADLIPARQATLQAIEAATGKPVVQYVDTTFEMFNDSTNTNGAMESTATFGRPLDDFLNAEGSYTFHGRATYSSGCTGMRETTWSIHVDVGIDAGKTTTTSVDLPPGGGGQACVRLTFTPRDRFGNLLGPGRADGFTIEPQPGSTLASSVTDLGNGSYQIDVCGDSASLQPPQVGIVQPGRPPVLVGPGAAALYAYSVTFLCGERRGGECCGCAPVVPGRYATEINIHNYHDRPVAIRKSVIPVVLAGAVVGREPASRDAMGRPDVVKLPPQCATMDDCCRLVEMMLGAPSEGPLPLYIGLLEILSTQPIAVTAVYTTTGDGATAPAIEVVQVDSHVVA
jgi:Trypsin-like peptidase domain/von Willebrand factor type A domain